ncbi:MAG: tetratricopeptide repeat protein, partial [Thermostichus sp. HHBFW_bins_43]
MTEHRPEISAQLSQGVQAYLRGDLSAAKESLHKVLQSQPHHADVLCLLGIIARREGELSQAIQYLQRSLIFKPQAPET